MLPVRRAMRALISLKAYWTAPLLAGLLLQPALAQSDSASNSARTAVGQQPSMAAPPPGSLPAAPDTVLPDETASPVRIFLPPPNSWDRGMANMRPALSQGRSDFTAITGGVAFGTMVQDVNAQLSKPYARINWDGLPEAQEYPGDVRYFYVPFNDAGPLKAGTQRCAGDGSYVVFLFSQTTLFRLSYRLVPDRTCPSVRETARDIFARYITIGETVSLTSRYHTGSAEVVDITDPTASFLIPVRWYQVAK
jgi:hypothetical protein